MPLESQTLLRRLLDEAAARLQDLPQVKVTQKPSPKKWSPKEHLGQLLDSAANNYQRLIRTQLEESPALPGYDRDRWVELQGYQQRYWQELVESWRVLNRQLLGAVEATQAAAWQRTCTIDGAAPVTLQFMFDDYVDHLLHHLKHIGINVSDFKPGMTTEARRPTTD